MPTFILNSDSVCEKSGKKFWEHIYIYGFVIVFFFFLRVGLLFCIWEVKKISVLLKISRIAKMDMIRLKKNLGHYSPGKGGARNRFQVVRYTPCPLCLDEATHPLHWTSQKCRMSFFYDHFLTLEAFLFSHILCSSHRLQFLKYLILPADLSSLHKQFSPANSPPQLSNPLWSSVQNMCPGG